MTRELYNLTALELPHAYGSPIGLQIVGHRFDDAGVMMLAHSYEELRLPMRPWPDSV